MSKKPRWLFRQNAAIPYTVEDNEVKIIIVTTRSKKNWTIPKGVVERLLFPAESAAQEALEKAGVKGRISDPKLVMEKTSEMLDLMMGDTAGEFSQNYEAIRSFHKPSREMALQNWMEHMERTGRTYTLPSRRGQYDDLVRPGVNREGQTLHIVLENPDSYFKPPYGNVIAIELYN